MASEQGPPRNLGDPIVSANKPEGQPAIKGPGSRRQASSQRGSERGTSPRHYRAKETKRGGRDHGESERSQKYRGSGGTDPRDPAERRGAPGHGTAGGKDHGTPISDTVSTRLQRIAELAREDPKRAFRSLAHHIDVEFLQEAFSPHTQGGATGVDGQTSGRVRGATGGESPVATRPLQVGTEQGTSSSTHLRAEGRREETAPHRDTDLRGQGAATSRDHGSGGLSTSRTFELAHTATALTARRTRR